VGIKTIKPARPSSTTDPDSPISGTAAGHTIHLQAAHCRNAHEEVSPPSCPLQAQGAWALVPLTAAVMLTGYFKSMPLYAPDP